MLALGPLLLDHLDGRHVARHRLGAREVGVADSRRQGVGAVVGPRVVVERQDAPHHVDDLPLVGRSRAHHGLLYLHGRVLPHLEAPLGAGRDGRTPRVRRGYGRALVLAEEDLLDGQLRGTEGADDLVYLGEDLAQAAVERVGGGGGHAAVCPGPAEGPPRLHDAPARVG